MKILAFIGSPRKKGNTVALVKKICDAASQKGHETKIVHIYDMKIHGCTACEACTERKVDICIHNDDFNKIAPEIIAADCFIFASPIYMGQITGPLKTFLDRWYTFAEEDFSIRHVMGKKFVTVTTSGAPAAQFSDVTEYLKHWLGDFYKMKHLGSLIGGELSDEGDVKKREDLLKEAEKIGQSL